MKKELTINMGNDEFILYIRKTGNCSLTNEKLGKMIWEEIHRLDCYARQVKLNQPCIWGEFTINTDPANLPKTAAQFEFNRTILPELYTYLDTIKNQKYFQ